jgi:hypothetical protein
VDGTRGVGDGQELPVGGEVRLAGGEAHVVAVQPAALLPRPDPPEPVLVAPGRRRHQPAAVGAEGDPGHPLARQLAHLLLGARVPDPDPLPALELVGGGRPAAVGAERRLGEAELPAQRRLLAPRLQVQDHGLTRRADEHRLPAVGAQGGPQYRGRRAQALGRADPQAAPVTGQRPGVQARLPVHKEAPPGGEEQHPPGARLGQEADLLARVEVPQAHARGAGGRQQSPVRAEGGVLHGPARPLPVPGAALPAAVHPPDFQRQASPAAQQQGVVPAELEGQARAGVGPAQDEPPGPGVPQPQRVVPAGARQQVAGAVEGERAEVPARLGADRQPPAGGDVPDVDAVGGAGAGEELAVRVPAQGRQTRGAREGANGFVGVEVVDRDDRI